HQHLEHGDAATRLAGGLILAGVALQSLTSGIAFRGYYAENTAEVAGSQRPMASYVAESVPAGAVVGVHDIGVAAFYGQHPTYDLVGLTTPNAAVAWRNGPGAVYESMARSPYRPDYLAIYPDARGLTYFAGTGLFANPLAEFPSLALPHNVASATNSGQTVYKIDWSPLDGQEQPRQPSTLTAIGDLRLVDVLNIAYLPDEATHEYHWWQAAQPPGFPTELYRQSYVACAADCTVQDGGRLITGGESFTMATRPAEDALWVIRVHPRQAMTITLYAGDQVVGQRVIPAIPGTWIEIPTLITGDKITTERTTFRVEAALNDPSADHYMPYQHWLYQGRYPPVETPTEPPLAQFDAGFAVQRAVLNYAPDSRVFSATITWFNGNSPAPVDGILFIHLYDKYDGLRQDAQIDQRPGGGALPPGNWLPGGFTETYQRRLPSSIAPGVYRVAIGMYDPLRGRLPLEGEGVDTDLRLWVGTITVE
ncbi:MAG TPA: hypothetical protein PLD47_09945, partial [Aggregatilineales bacterium]|nr:hypothetical protein [Aggregatilineales bacterium]